MKTVKDYISDLNRVCREKQLRLTPQRLEVYRALVKTCEHPSADWVLRKVRRRIPNISHDTVYRTLNWLVDNGLIFQVGVVNGVARYDGNLDFHFHCICENCNSVLDIFPEKCRAEEFYKYLPGDFSANQVHLQFIGLCNKCNN
ncbi:MAG: Fur family transcriptional regulator [Candidatus Rifleibacteriota bacterium]